MNSKGNIVLKILNSFGLILLLMVFSLATLHAQNAAPTQPATQVAAPQAAPASQATQPAAPTAVLRGHVADPTGAMIPGAKVTLTSAKGRTLGTGISDSAGGYEFDGLIQGSYIVLASADGFAPFASKPIPILAGQSKRVDIAMAVEADQQSVVVTDESPTVNVDAGGNTNAIVLKGADLDALSDDPDELSSELSALAGPAAGPNGGQIYIDGFTGGQLPQNPPSAKFASTRIPSPQSSITSVMAALKFSPSPALTSSTVPSSLNTTTRSSTPAVHSIQMCSPTTASNSTAP